MARSRPDDRAQASKGQAKGTVMIVDEQLQDLLGQERALSRKRQQLHRRVEYLRGTGAHDPSALELVARLTAEEHEVSQKRRELHATIERLRG
jgi:hypothetical protein